MEPLASDPLSFSAEIPAAALAEGALLRWAAAATAALPGSPQSAARCPRRGDDWLGTAVLEPTEPSNLPVMEWFRSPNSSEGGSGDWVWFAGVLRPLAAVSRKGATSLGWPKPKLKLEFKKGCDVEETDGEKLVLRPPFVLQGEGEGAGAAPMSLVDLDSLWWEPGSNSYVRQAAAFEALRRVKGAPALLTRHIVVRRDKAFYGLHALTERAGGGWLRREKLLPPSSGGDDASDSSNDFDVSLYKPISASAALVPDVPLNLMRLVWKTEHGETRHGDIDDFCRKLANGRARGGGGSGNRGGSSAEDAAAAWLLETIDLPRTLNYLSTAAVLNQQDHCTKNYYLLQERDRKNGGLSRWSLLAGDSKSAFGSDSGFGGEAEHARDYALNHSDQFASPLFCGRGHPQDVEASSAEPWSGVVVELLDGVRKRSGGGSRRRGRKRRSVLATREEEATTPTATATATAAAPRIEAPPANRPAAPRPLGCAADTTSLSKADGSPSSTFNALADALLRCPATRAMFLRRCRTLTGQLHGSFSSSSSSSSSPPPPPSSSSSGIESRKGALFDIVGNLTSAVAAAAARDDAAWRGGDPSLGSRQLLQEQIPGRGRQLEEAYGAGGYVADGLLPAPQPLPLPASAVRVFAAFPSPSSPPPPSALTSSSGSSGSSSSSSSSPPQLAPPPPALLVAVSATSPETSLDLSGYSLRIGRRELAFPAGTVNPPGGWVLIVAGRSRGGGDGQKRRRLLLPPALGTRLARDAGLSGMILTVGGGEKEVESAAADASKAVALVAPGGEVVVVAPLKEMA